MYSPQELGAGGGGRGAGFISTFFSKMNQWVSCLHCSCAVTAGVYKASVRTELCSDRLQVKSRQRDKRQENTAHPSVCPTMSPSFAPPFKEKKGVCASVCLCCVVFLSDWLKCLCYTNFEYSFIIQSMLTSRERS